MAAVKTLYTQVLTQTLAVRKMQLICRVIPPEIYSQFTIQGGQYLVFFHLR